MKRILIVDDGVTLADTLRDFLEDAGYHVQIAGNGVEALELMRRERPDLVLTDLMMPRMDGKQLLVAMRADLELSTVAAVLMTAVRRQIAVSRSESFPAISGFLRKPFGLPQLMDAVAAALDRDGDDRAAAE